MKHYPVLASSFFIVAALLFVGNRLYEAIKSIGLTTLYYLSLSEKVIYGVSFVFLIAGVACIYLAIRESKQHK